MNTETLKITPKDDVLIVSGLLDSDKAVYELKCAVPIKHREVKSIKSAKYTTPMKRRKVAINSNDYWIKITGMLQQSYALIDKQDDGKFKIFFTGETSWIFDEIEFDSEAEAVEGLNRNKFIKHDKELHEFIYLPKPPFSQAEYMNDPIYSSGKYWS
jgi:hypothetical protein